MVGHQKILSENCTFPKFVLSSKFVPTKLPWVCLNDLFSKTDLPPKFVPTVGANPKRLFFCNAPLIDRWAEIARLIAYLKYHSTSLPFPPPESDSTTAFKAIQKLLLRNLSGEMQTFDFVGCSIHLGRIRDGAWRWCSYNDGSGTTFFLRGSYVSKWKASLPVR